MSLRAIVIIFVLANTATVLILDALTAAIYDSTATHGVPAAVVVSEVRAE